MKSEMQVLRFSLMEQNQAIFVTNNEEDICLKFSKWVRVWCVFWYQRIAEEAPLNFGIK